MSWCRPLSSISECPAVPHNLGVTEHTAAYDWATNSAIILVSLPSEPMGCRILSDGWFLVNQTGAAYD